MDKLQWKDKVYVLTLDLGNKVKSLRHTGLKTIDPGDSFFSTFHDGLVNRIQDALHGVSVQVISMDSLAEKIISRAIDKSSVLSDAVIVSTCSEIAVPSKGHVLEINRLVDSNGSILGLGPRPGHPPLEDQIDGIAHLTRGQKIVLVEDGAFSGETLLYVVKKFKEKGVDLKAIVIGFVFPGSLEKVKDEFIGEILVMEEIGVPLDWIPDHDFTPFIPNCGRVVGVGFNETILPFYTYNGASYSVPYVHPFSPMEKWASIPEKSAYAISEYCLRETRKLFLALEELNGRKIKVKDLVLGSARSKVSVPFKINSGRFLQMFDVNVEVFLKDVYSHGILHIDKNKY